MIGRAVTLLAVTVAGVLLWSEPLSAQSLSLDLADAGPSATGRVVQLLGLLTVLSLAPSILVMVTSFTRIIVVLSFLRTALGIQQTPPNQVLISLALFLTFFVMTPTLEQAYEQGIRPLIEGKIDEMQAFERAVQPVRVFMAEHVREQEMALFAEMAHLDSEPAGAQAPLRVLIPAFMVSELRRAFEIGFLVFVPFLIIDMAIASILMSMGMMMLPPIVISLIVGAITKKVRNSARLTMTELGGLC